jgi:hypothetical protein
MRPIEAILEWLKTHPEIVTEAIEGPARWQHSPDEIDQQELLKWLRAKNPDLPWERIGSADLSEVVLEFFI